MTIRTAVCDISAIIAYRHISICMCLRMYISTLYGFWTRAQIVSYLFLLFMSFNRFIISTLTNMHVCVYMYMYCWLFSACMHIYLKVLCWLTLIATRHQPSQSLEAPYLRLKTNIYLFLIYICTYVCRYTTLLFFNFCYINFAYLLNKSIEWLNIYVCR